MINEEFLNNLVSSSFYPDKLMHLMGMECNESGKITDLGHFNQLDTCCVVSLGLDNGLERAPNAERANIRLRESDIQKICKILNDNNFPAVTEDNAKDVSKILVTDSGIQLPYQKAEDGLSMLSDVVDVLQEHSDIVIQGFAHPITADGITMAKVGEVSWSAEIADNSETQGILAKYGSSQQSFVSEMLEETKNIGLDQEKINDLIEKSPGNSLFRGATLGDQPFAVMSKVDCKNFVYASSEFNTAQMYADDCGRGYTAADGKKYGFIYEYDVSENQKYYCDYGLENAQKDFDNAGYETDVYAHKNKLKGIYLKCGETIAKIADENGYISEKWQDFAKLHNPVNRMKNENLVARNNAIYATAQEERPLCSYNKRNYEYSSLSIEEAKKQKNEETHSTEAIHLKGKINDISIIDNVQGPFIIKNAGLENINLGYKQIELQGQFTCNNETKFPDYLKLKNAEIPQEANLSDVKQLTLDGNIKIGEETKMPNEVYGHWAVLSDSHLKSDTNYGKIENLTLSGKIEIDDKTQLPNNTTLKDITLNSADLSQIENLSLKGNVELAAGTKLPDKVSTYDLNLLKIHDTDISQIKEIASHKTPPIVILDEKNNPVCTIGDTYGNDDITFKDNGYSELKRYPSLDVYKKCKDVEEKLTSWGIDKGSYMMITPEDNAYISYGSNEHRSLDACFKDCKDDLNRTNSPVVYGSNNGVIAAYFSEDVYIISHNPELRDVLYHKGRDTSIGVVMSNGEEFRTQFNEPDKKLNLQYKDVKEWKPQKEQKTDINSVEALSDKEKIAALSGRDGGKTNYAITTEKTSTLQQTAIKTENNQANPTPTPQKSDSQQSPLSQSATKQETLSVEPQEKVADMDKKQKWNFFKNLRMGVNTILAKAEAKLSPTLNKPKIETRLQPNIIQMKITKDKGNGLK